MSRRPGVDRRRARTRVAAVAAAAALTFAGCSQSALPAADPGSARVPTPIQQPNGANDSLVPTPAEAGGADPGQAHSSEAQSSAVQSSAVQSSAVERAEAQPPETGPVVGSLPPDQASESPAAGGDSALIVDLRIPATDNTWIDITANLVGLESACENVSIVAAHPKRRQLLAGVAAQGLFEFDDATSTWSPLGTDVGSAAIEGRTEWIEFDQLEPLRFWQVGSQGLGLFRTDDGGAGFTRLGDLQDLAHLSVDSTDPFRAVLLAGAHDQGAVFRSADGGATWENVAEQLPPDIGTTLYPIVFGRFTHTVGSTGSDRSGVFFSRDAGATWTQTFEGAVSGAPVVAGNEVFWLLADGAGVLHSSNQGFSFELGAPTGGRPSTLAQLSDGRLLTHNDERLLVSSDDGRSWTEFGPELPFEPRGVEVSNEDDAVFAWRSTCSFLGGQGNDVQPQSIMRLAADFDQP